MISATTGPTWTRTRLPIGAIDVTGAVRWFSRESSPHDGAERNVPRIDGDVHAPERVVGAPGREAAVERDLRQPILRPDRVPPSSERAGERRDERIGGHRDELGRRAELEDAPVADDADAVGERGGILEVVGDEERRQRERVEQLAKLGSDSGPRMGVERGERLVEQQNGGIPRQRTGEGDPLALAAGELAHARAGEVADAEALEELVDPRAVAGAEAHVPDHVEMREERVLLEQVADAAALGRDVDCPGRCRAGPSRRRDRARLRLEQPATTRSVVVLPAPDGPTSASVSPGETVRSADATKERRG